MLMSPKETAMRVRLVVEYDLDLEPGTEVTDEMLTNEHRDWMEGSINVQDVMGSDCNPKFTLTRA